MLFYGTRKIYMRTGYLARALKTPVETVCMKPLCLPLSHTLYIHHAEDKPIEIAVWSYEFCSAVSCVDNFFNLRRL